MSATFGLLLHFQLAALDNLDLLLGAVHRSGGGVLNLLDDVVALEHFAKDDVAAIQPPMTCQYCNRMSITEIKRTR